MVGVATGLLAGTEGALRQVLAAHDDWVRCLDITVNGKYVISGSNDFTVKVCNSMHSDDSLHDCTIMLSNNYKHRLPLNVYLCMLPLRFAIA